MMAGNRWGRVLLWALPLIALAALFAFGPIPQPPDYHQFADRRAALGIPHFANVVSNLAFLLAGTLGLFHCLERRPAGALGAWILFFAGFVAVAFGSGYYHLNPGNETLVWDRLGMSIGLAGIYGALMTEYVAARLGKYLLAAALAVALGSVLYWSFADDLRFYLAVQGIVFLSALVILAWFENAYGQKRFFVWALVIYALAIACEQLDIPIFMLTGGVIGGHAVKHLLAALAAYLLYGMLRRRSITLRR